MTSLFFAALGAFFFSLPFPGLVFTAGLGEGLPSFFIGLLGLSILVWGILKLPKWRSLYFLMIFFVIHYLMTFYWVTFPIHEFKGISKPLSHSLGLVFFLINFGHYFLVWFLTKGFNFQKFLQDERQRFLVVALLVASLDFYYPQILPTQAGLIFYFLSSSIWASIGGTSFLTFVLIYGLLLFWSSETKFKFYIVSFFVLILSGVEFIDQSEKGEVKNIKVSLVQPNVSNLAKIQAELGEGQALQTLMKILARQTRQATGLVFWPETAVPLHVSYEEMLPGGKQNWLYREIFNRNTLIFGAYVREGDKKATNSLLAWDLGKLHRYDKGYLKPFAEELPFGDASPLIASFLGLEYPVTRGSNQKLFEMNGVKFFGSVCYEALKPNYIMEMLRSFKIRPHFLINVANDGWFGKTSQPYLHFLMNEFLSEQINLPVIRAANTGISGIAFPDGRESLTTPWHQEAVLNAEITYFETRPTLFQKLGFLSTFGFATFLLMIHFLLNFLKRKG
jgi:apolipoprotein N-acyltransferase